MGSSSIPKAARRRSPSGSSAGGRPPWTCATSRRDARCCGSTSSPDSGVCRSGGSSTSRSASGSPSWWTRLQADHRAQVSSGAGEDVARRGRRCAQPPLQPRRQGAVAEDRTRGDAVPRHARSRISPTRSTALSPLRAARRILRDAGRRDRRAHLGAGRPLATSDRRRAVARRGERPIVVNPPKTRAGHRHVPVPRVVADALAASTQPNPAPTDWVVPSPRARPSASRRSGAGCGRPPCGKPASTGSASTTSATLPWRSGSRREHHRTKSRAAGHRSVVTVLDRYGHLFPDRRDDVTDELDRMAGGLRARPRLMPCSISSFDATLGCRVSDRCAHRMSSITERYAS